MKPRINSVHPSLKDFQDKSLTSPLFIFNRIKSVHP